MPLSRPLKYVLLLTTLCAAPLSAALASEPAMVSKMAGKNVTWVSGENSSKPGVQTLLAPGDRISAGKGSFVDVEFLADSCTVRVNAGDTLTIGETSPCAAAAQAAAVIAPEASAKSDRAAETARVIPAAAGAAEVSSKTGSFTRANMGGGMVDISVGDSLNVGDEVFAGPNSSVSLYFPVPGCSYTVTAGNIYKVASQAPCKAAAAVDSGSSAVAEGGASSVSPGVVVGAVAGVAVIGGVALLAINSDDDDGNNNPATPD